MIYHLTDNSGRFHDDGWFYEGGPCWQGFYDYHWPVVDQYKVPVFFRQPIPTASVNPMHMSGWQQTADRAHIWHKDYTKTVRKLQKYGRSIIYKGFSGGDTRPRKENGGKPYDDDPVIKAAFKKGPDHGRDAFNLALSADIRTGSHMAFDVSEAMDPESPYWKELEATRTALQASGRTVYSEPTEPGNPRQRAYAPCSTWGVFEGNPDAMGLYSQPGLVLVDSNPPKDLNEDEWLSVMADRTIEVLRRGHHATLSLHPMRRAGLDSLTTWLAKYGGR